MFTYNVTFFLNRLKHDRWFHSCIQIKSLFVKHLKIKNAMNQNLFLTHSIQVLESTSWRLQIYLASRSIFFLVRVGAQDPDSLDPQDFGFLHPDPKKYSDLRIRIQGVNYHPKNDGKKFSKLLKKERLYKFPEI